MSQKLQGTASLNVMDFIEERKVLEVMVDDILHS